VTLFARMSRFMQGSRARVLVASIVLLLGWWMVATVGADRASPWAVVTTGDLVLRVDVEGTLAAVRTHLMSPPPVRGGWEYKIKRMADDGSDVKQGDDVLTFDTSELERRHLETTAILESAEKEIEKKRTNIIMRRRDDDLRLAEAQAKLAKTRLQLERPEQFVAAKEIATLELDRDLAEKEVAYLENRRRLIDEADETELGILSEQRDQAALRVRELQSGIDRMTLKAPQDGTVIHVTDRRGEKKRVGDAVWRRDKVLEIPDLTEMVARGIVDESDAGRIEAGQPVELRLDAYPDVTFGGSIEKIGKTVQAKTRNSPLRAVRVDIALDETDQNRMRPEMRFRGQVEFGRRDDVLLIPMAAVTQTAAGALVSRRLLSGSEEVPVELGARNTEMVEVLSGLADGDQVLLRR